MIRSNSTAIILTCMLSACSGGGSCPTDGNGGEGNPPAPDLQASVPSPTYALNSRELAYFNAINQIRQQLGLGLLAQSAQLDEVASSHAQYLDYSGTGEEIDSGIENPQKWGFSGVTAQNRCDFTGYLGQCQQSDMWSEVAYVFRPSPYLGLQILNQGVRQVGIAMHSTFLFTGMSNGPEIQTGLPTGSTRQRQAAGFVFAASLWGGIHVHINEGETLTYDAFQIWDTFGNGIPGDVLTSQTDPRHRVPSHAVMLLPSAGGLTCDGSAYTLYFSGKRNGVPFTLLRTLTLDQNC